MIATPGPVPYKGAGPSASLRALASVRGMTLSVEIAVQDSAGARAAIGMPRETPPSSFTVQSMRSPTRSSL